MLDSRNPRQVRCILRLRGPHHLHAGGGDINRKLWVLWSMASVRKFSQWSNVPAELGKTSRYLWRKLNSRDKKREMSKCRAIVNTSTHKSSHIAPNHQVGLVLCMPSPTTRCRSSRTFLAWPTAGSEQTKSLAHASLIHQHLPQSLAHNRCSLRKLSQEGMDGEMRENVKHKTPDLP